MVLESLRIPATNRFASLYLQQEEPVTSFFHYNLNANNVYSKRLEYIKERDFARQGLVDCITAYMENLPSSTEVRTSLERLKKDAVVVIGGQQAGLLTGPLYTIHKVISIIKFAEEKEKELNHPVVPVFWIAGEDHDFEEINHVFLQKNGKMVKKGYPERVLEKKMASHIHLSKDVMKDWTEEILKEFGETSFTTKIQQMLITASNSTETIVEFFAYLTMELFKEYGLLVIDSAFPPLRKLETTFFHELLDRNKELTESVLEQQKIIKGNGFSSMLDVSENAANLFLQWENERLLLETEGDYFKDKSGKVIFTKQELLSLLEREPEKFSNNVVTRPLMQEWLFPSIAFIAGPGEIAYWGELKRAFELVGLEMPPVVPRLNITVVEREAAKRMEQYDVTPLKVMTEGVESSRQSFWDSIQDPGFEQELNDAKQYLENKYKNIMEKALTIDKSLEPIVEKNVQFHLKQFDFLLNKSEKALKQRHDVVFRQLNFLESSLRPNGGPQERTWNILYFLNKYDLSFINELTDQPYVFDGMHKLLYI
jgi:bacillithiol synthase